MPDLRDVRCDLGIRRRHDLAAVAEIDLVTVVQGRVVARRHHDAGIRSKVTDREGQHRSRQRAGQHHGPATSSDNHGCRICGEDVRVVSGVEPDDHQGMRLGLFQVCRQPGCRTDHHGAVHPVGAGPQRTSKSGGAELEHAHEPVGQICPRLGITCRRGRDHRVELCTRGRVGIVVVPPGGGALEQLEGRDIRRGCGLCLRGGGGAGDHRGTSIFATMAASR